jgi:hypothetical protein
VKRLLVLLVLAAACGKRGDPRPPVPVIPQATSDLVVAQRAAKVLLTWSYPALTTSGRSLPAIRRIIIYRHLEELPSPVAGRDMTPADAAANFAKVPTLTASQFAKLCQRIDSIEGANLPAATAGDKLQFEDSPTLRGTSGRPVRLTYAVATEGVSARGELSNLAVIVPLPVAVAPSGLTAEARPEGVVLRWSEPALAATGEGKPVIVGYNIFRDTEALDKPSNPTPITGSTHTDKPPYGQHTYRITAVASAGPPLIQSDPSAPASAEFKDLVPPPPPANIVPLLETRVVRLVWDAAAAPDVKGYHVYRWQGTIRLRLTDGPTPNTFFGDESLEQGQTYIYSVTAVDTSGNESEPGNSPEVLLPRVPY